MAPSEVYDAVVLRSIWNPPEYTAVVTHPAGGPVAFCGHRHKTEAAAEHCRKGLVRQYQDWIGVLEHNAREIRQAEEGSHAAGTLTDSERESLAEQEYDARVARAEQEQG